jgi:hypothetical protein
LCLFPAVRVNGLVSSAIITAIAMDNVTSLQGTVEKVEGKLVLLIPLNVGGDQFIACSKSISELQGEYLKVVIPEWLAGMLRIEEGSLVTVDNENGKLNIHPVNPHPLQ